jgi:glycosyltransferase involved in cell wall biosynthesis
VSPDSTPLVSILTPSFNQSTWLPDNLRSVACQTYPRIEHIVMDGGSTDGSVETLEACGPGVRWQSEPDAGQADAINKAFRASRGEIVGWLNSDDAYFDCNGVEDVVRFFAEHPHIDVVYGHAVQITEDGHVIQVLSVPPFSANLLRTVDFITQPSLFVRRRVLAEPMLDVSFHFAMDYELWLRLLAQGARFARLDRILSVDRHQRGRKSTTLKDTWVSELARLAETYETRLGPEWESRRSRFYVAQRLRGALLVGRVRPPFAFTAPDDARRGVLARQLWQRRRDWPEEYR